jgi:hypothetical protein
MARRTLALLALAALTAGGLAACQRSEDSTFTDPGLRSVTPSPVVSAPLTVPFPTRQDNATIGSGAQ